MHMYTHGELNLLHVVNLFPYIYMVELASNYQLNPYVLMISTWQYSIVDNIQSGIFVEKNCWNVLMFMSHGKKGSQIYLSMIG